MNEKTNHNKPNYQAHDDCNQSNRVKYHDELVAYSHATLGISIVVALLIGFGIGYALESLFGIRWLFWLGIVWGVSAALLNVIKAYKKQKKELDALRDDPKYASRPSNGSLEEDEY